MLQANVGVVTGLSLIGTVDFQLFDDDRCLLNSGVNFRRCGMAGSLIRVYLALNQPSSFMEPLQWNGISTLVGTSVPRPPLPTQSAA